VISVGVIRQLYDYNCWARGRQLEACRALTPEQFTRSFGSGWSSIRDVLAHLVDTEAYYLHRWRGHSREQIVATMGFSRSVERARLWPAQFPTLSRVERHWQNLECEVRNYFEKLEQNDLSETVTYIDSGGRHWPYPLWQLILHLANHQTYHRGQVSALLRQLGVVPPATDLLDFYSTVAQA
jgi:uncharacterized damage-inducible protein DinB